MKIQEGFCVLFVYPVNDLIQLFFSTLVRTQTLVASISFSLLPPLISSSITPYFPFQHDILSTTIVKAYRNKIICYNQDLTQIAPTHFLRTSATEECQDVCELERLRGRKNFFWRLPLLAFLWIWQLPDYYVNRLSFITFTDLKQVCRSEKSQ